MWLIQVFSQIIILNSSVYPDVLDISYILQELLLYIVNFSVMQLSQGVWYIGLWPPASLQICFQEACTIKKGEHEFD